MRLIPVMQGEFNIYKQIAIVHWIKKSYDLNGNVKNIWQDSMIFYGENIKENGYRKNASQDIELTLSLIDGEK